VPLPQKVAYGIGGMTENLANSLTQQMINPVFNIGLGISPTVLGVVLMIYRLWDAFADVFMGNLSDNTRSRWGRRRPFLVVGGLLTGLTFPLIWQARPEWSDTLTIGWALGAGLVFYSAFSIWAMPYYSLGMEMTPDYDERTRVVAQRAFFSKFVGLVSGWLMTLISLPLFAGLTAEGKPDLVAGMRNAGWIIGGVILLVAILPGLLVRERYYEKEVRRQPKVPLVKSFKETLRCRPFLLIIGIVVVQGLGYGVVGSLGLYLNIYYVFQGDVQAASLLEGFKSTACFLPGLLSVPFWTWASERFGKNATLAATLVIGMVANAAMFVCYTPEHPYLQIVPSLLMSAFGFGIWMIAPSMQADIVDHDELHTGERREGSFSAVFSWSLKLAGTLCAGISGLVIVWSGFDIAKYGDHQPPEVMLTMLSWYSFIPLFFCGVALVLLKFYPLDRARMHEIRARLEARRGRV
jgi:GPH family glycoside/pentoside/hexuronide:cation symporter